MISRNRKLPQSSYYLEAAKYGIDAVLKQRSMDEGFLFFTVGILASLRAVQHALLNHDSTLSPEHERTIEAWKKSTPFDWSGRRDSNPRPRPWQGRGPISTRCQSTLVPFHRDYDGLF
jgi:hypothetical protein